MPVEQVKELWRRINAGELSPEEETRARGAISAYEKRMSGTKAQSKWVGAPELGLDEETRTDIAKGKQEANAEQYPTSEGEEESAREAASTPALHSRGVLGDPRAATGLEAIEAGDRKLPARKPSFSSHDPNELKAAEALAVQGKSPNHALALKILQSNPDRQDAIEELTRLTGMDSADALDVVAESISMLPDARNQIAAIPNMSKTPEFTGEIEYVSRAEQAQGLAPWEIAMPVMRIMHTEWQEPGIDEFRRDMRDYMHKNQGIDVETLDEESPYFKRYADMRWERALEQAKAGDRTIRRASMTDKLRPGGKGREVVGAVLGNLLRADQSYTFGLATELNAEAAGLVPGAPSVEANREAMRSFRGAQGSAAGEIAGALTPGGATQGLLRAGGKMLPEAAGMGLNIARSAALGAGTAGIEQGAKDVVENIGPTATGGDPITPWGDIPGRVGTAAFFGGAFGAGGGLLEEGAKGLKRSTLSPMSPSGHNLRQMEDVGIERGVFGAKLTPEAKAYEKELTASGESIEGSMSRRLVQPIAKAAYNYTQRGGDDLLPRWTHNREMYYRSPEGVQQTPINELADEAIRMVEQRTKGGGPLPGVLSVETLRKQLPLMFDEKTFREVPAHEAARLKGTAWRKLPIAGKEAGTVVIAKPRTVDARTLDEIIHGLDERAGFAKKGIAVPDEAWVGFDHAARKMRDKYTPNEWTQDVDGNQLRVTHSNGSAGGLSALNARIAESKRGASDDLEAAGLPAELKLRSKTGTTETMPPPKPKAGPPKKLDDVGEHPKTVEQMNDEARGFAWDDPGPGKTAWRQRQDFHRGEYMPRVQESLDPQEYLALQMFTLGYDAPIRMARRGVPDDKIIELYYKAEKADYTPDEFLKRVHLAAGDIDSILAKAPKATHVPEVYRGVALTRDQIDGILKDGSFNMGGMPSSATRSLAMADTFAVGSASKRNITPEGFQDNAVPVLLKLKHKSGVGIETLSKAGKAEEEILLPGNASFKVTSVSWAKDPRRAGAGSNASRVLLIEAKELGKTTRGKVPPAKTTGDLDIDLSENTLARFEAQLQAVRKSEGAERKYTAVLKLARMAGPEVEQEVLTKAGMLAAKRLMSGAEPGGVGIGITPSGAHPRGVISNLSKVKLGLTATANTLKAKPIGTAPPSEQLRWLLRIMGKKSQSAVPPYPDGPRPFALGGMASGGGGPLGVGQDEQLGVGLDPYQKARVAGGTPDGAPQALPPREQSLLDELVSDLADFMVEQTQKMRGETPAEATP